MRAENRRKVKQFADYKSKALRETEKQCREYASQIPNQAILDVVLTQEKDPFRRLELFKFMKQYMTFPNPQMPEVVHAAQEGQVPQSDIAEYTN